MLRNIKIRLRDWWRGYTNGDLAAGMRKMEGPHEWGACVTLSDAENKAWRDVLCGNINK